MNSTKTILKKISVVASLLLLVVGLSVAYFSDTEISAGNVLAVGGIDLKIDNTSWLNGVAQPLTSWTLDDLVGKLFFNFNDLKPGDLGEDTVSFHVDDNDSWLCGNITLTESADNGINEPEGKDGDATDDQWAGELDEKLNFIFWADDGDNVLEDNEKVLLTGGPDELPQGDGNAGFDFTIADATNNIFTELPDDPLDGGVTYYIGKAFCFGNLAQAPVTAGLGVNPGVDPGVTCDGSLETNISQTDSVRGDVSFSAVQARELLDYICGQPIPSPVPTPTPLATLSPSPVACGQADVMLVLDRSGSINSTELGQLKTAAKDFVDALTLTDPGIHAGQTSFSTGGTLDHHLTFDSTSLKAAIDALVAGGWTNLKAGIDLAIGELDDTHVHERPGSGSPDKMVIITDGHPNRPLPSNTADDAAATSADNARLAGSEIFVVGVGGDVDATYLQTEIADDASHYYSASNYSGLETTLQNLDLCP